MAGKANGRKARNGRNGGGEITMSDIARHAGVSPMTVSRALSDPPSVSDKMRRKVDAAVRQFGYLPNRIAGSLSSKRSNVIGLVVPSIRNSLYAAMIHAISDVARANGLHLMIANSGHRLEDEEALVSALLAQRVCGLVLHNTAHSKRLRELLAAHRHSGGRDRQPAGQADRHGGELLQLRRRARHDRPSRPAGLQAHRLRHPAAARQRPLARAPPRLFRGAEGARPAGRSRPGARGARRLRRGRRCAGPSGADPSRHRRLLLRRRRSGCRRAVRMPAPRLGGARPHRHRELRRPRPACATPCRR